MKCGGIARCTATAQEGILLSTPHLNTPPHDIIHLKTYFTMIYGHLKGSSATFSESYIRRVHIVWVRSKVGGTLAVYQALDPASRNAGNQDPTFRAVAVKDR